MSDPLSITAGVTSLLVFAGAMLSKGYSIVHLLKASTEEVERLLAELSQLTGILVGIEAQKKQSPSTASKTNASVLNDAVARCRKTLQHVQQTLESLGRSRKAVLAIKWHLHGPEVRSLMLDLAGHRATFTLCLGFDAR